MADFTDNQTVTAASLNQIAIDLGKTTFSDFADGTQYSVDALNGITADIVTAGVAPNSTIYDCKCMIGSGKIKIEPGLIFFNTGAKMRINSNLLINYTASDTVQYVYAYNDTSLNTARIVIDETEPTQSMDTVMLCTVKSGVMTDMRKFAQARVSLPTAASIYQYEEELSFYSSKEQQYTIDNNQPYVLAAVLSSFNGNGYKAYQLENGVTIEIPLNSVETIKLTKQGTKIVISTSRSGGRSDSTVKILFV